MLSYLKENLQNNNPPENQSIRLIYCPLPQTVAPLKVTIIKACVRYFLSNLYFSLNDSPSKTMKNVFYINLKSSFRFRDIQMFVFPSFPLFLLVSHCFRG